MEKTLMGEEQIKELVQSLANPLILFSQNQDVQIALLEQQIHEEVVSELMTLSNLGYQA